MSEAGESPVDTPAEASIDGASSDGGGTGCRRRLSGAFRHVRQRWRLSAGIGVVATLTGVVLLAAAPIGANTADRDSVTLDLGGTLVYHPLAPFMADLTPSNGTTAFLRLVVVVEAPQSAVSRLQDRDVAITAAIQSQLRSFRRAEVVGRAGADRLRADVRAIINRTIAPAEVRTVYFTEILLD